MWTILASIVGLVTVVVPLLCMVYNPSKSEEEKVEEDSYEETGEVFMEGFMEGADLEAVFKDEVKPSTAEETSEVERKKEKFGIRIAELNCSGAFNGLNPHERLYAHYTAKAFFEGALLRFIQISPDAAATFVLLYRVFWFESIATLKQKADELGITEIEWQNFLLWAATNLTVDRTGDINQRMPHEKLMKLIAVSTAATIYPDLWATYESIAKAEFPPADMNATSKFLLIKRHLIGLNCRGYNDDADGKNILKIKVASTNFEFSETTIYGVKVQIEKGEYSKFLDNICNYLNMASEHASGKQKAMLDQFMEYFRTGEHKSYLAAKQIRRSDGHSTVRSSYFFFKNPFAPSDVQSQFVGMVAVVNKEATNKYTRLASKANHILTKLPWGRAYEKSTDVEPNFAVLDVIAVGYNTYKLSIGYNCTSEDTMGHSHVFSNVISAMEVNTDFIKEGDVALLREYDRSAKELSNFLHEMFGHGSGKLFKRLDDGTFNFDKENTTDILTGCKVDSWYEPGQSYYSVFGDLAEAIEECRAFAVEYLLGADTEVLEWMGYEGEAGQSIKYVIWLKLLRDGLRGNGIKFNIQDAQGRDNHAWARNVLARVILEAGNESTGRCATIEKVKRDLYIHLDKDRIDTVGVPAVREFLKKIQAYKSTANVEGATELLNKYACKGNEHFFGGGANDLFVQPNTVLNEDGGVDLFTYDATPEGVIQSVIDRYAMDSIDNLEELWKAEVALRETLAYPIFRSPDPIPKFAPGVMRGRRSRGAPQPVVEEKDDEAKTPFWWMRV